jgi:hypothetical protein
MRREVVTNEEFEALKTLFLYKYPHHKDAKVNSLHLWKDGDITYSQENTIADRANSAILIEFAPVCKTYRMVFDCHTESGVSPENISSVLETNKGQTLISIYQETS